MTAVLTKVSLPTIILKDLVARAVKGSTMVDLIPLTCFMHIKVKDNTLYVSTTDNINFLNTTEVLDPSAKVEDFEMIVQSKLFSQLMTKLTTATTTFTIEGNKVTIEADGKYNMPLEVDVDGSAIKFPEMTFEAVGKTLTVTAAEIKSILALNKSCKADMKDVPALYNYYMDSESVLTTNIYKACMNPVKVFDTPVCVSPTVMDLVSVICDETGVDVSQNEDYVMFSSTKGSLLGKKCLDADVEQFPAVDLVEVFSSDLSNSCKINRTMLINAVDRICLFTDAYQSNKLSLIFKDDALTLHSASTDSKEDISYLTPLATTLTDNVVIDIDGSFLKQQLTACDMEDLQIKFSQELGLQIKCNTVYLALGTLGEDELESI